MATDRVKLREESPLMKVVKTIDWSKHLQYGTIEILLFDGRVTLVTKKETEKPNGG